MTTPTGKSSSKVLLALFLSVFVDLIGFAIIAPLLPFVAERFGASPLGVTLLFALYSLMQLLFAPLWGQMSDRVGRRPVLLLSYVGSAVSYAFFAFAPTLVLVFAARALAGMMGSSIAVTKAYIADITTPENRAKGMGIIGAAFGSGFMIGPALGGILAGPNPDDPNFQLPLLVAAGLSLAAFAFAWVALPESRPQQTRRSSDSIQTAAATDAIATEQHGLPMSPSQSSSRSSSVSETDAWAEGNVKAETKGSDRRPFNLTSIAHVLRTSRTRQLITILFLFALATVGTQSILVLWCERQFEWGPRPIGFLFMFYGLISTIIQGGLSGPINKQFQERQILTVGIIAQGFGLFLVPLSSTLPLLLVSSGIWIIGEAISRPAINSLLSKSASEERQGITLGVAQSFNSLASIFGPIVAGALFTFVNGTWAFWGGTALLAVAIALSLQVKRDRAFRPGQSVG